MKYLSLILLVCSNLWAICEGDRFAFQVFISEDSFEKSYELEQIQLTKYKEYVLLVDKSNNESYMLNRTELSNDGAGNFELKTRNTHLPIKIEFYHDHESYAEGLLGELNFFGKKYPLNQYICTFDRIFYLF